MHKVVIGFLLSTAALAAIAVVFFREAMFSVSPELDRAMFGIGAVGLFILFGIVAGFRGKRA